MRVLVSTTAGLGHFGPLLPFAAACRRAGHDVVVAAPESFNAEVERAGFPHRPFADAPPDEWGAVMARLPSLTYDEAEAVVLGEVFAGSNVRAALPGLLALMEEWRPDLVLWESGEFGSHLAAERLGVPQVALTVGLGLVAERALPVVAAALEPARASLGLQADPARERLRAVPWCSMVPEALEDPAVPGPAGDRRFRPGGEDEQGVAPALVGWWPAEMADLPLVYLTFGTVARTVPHFASALPAALAAVADLGVRLLLTLGQAGDPETLGTLPANVHVERWVPQATVLPRAAAVVCHGGFGTVMGTLTAGVPLVVVPQFADQPYNAERVAAVGAGVALPLGPPDPAGLRDGVARVLGDPGYRERARAVAEAIRALAPADEAVPMFEEVAGARPRN